MSNITEYLKYYVGQKCKVKTLITDSEESDVWETGNIVYALADGDCEVFVDVDTFITVEAEEVKPILKRLKDMTEEDKLTLADILKVHYKLPESRIAAIEDLVSKWGRVIHNVAPENYVAIFHYLISKGYWVFNEIAFDEGLVIDAKTLTNE